MSYFETQPPAELRPFIACYWQTENPAHPSGKVHYVLPDGCEDLLFRQRAQGLSIEVVGLMTQGKRYTLTEPEKLWGIRFRSGQLQKFLHHNPSDYLNQNVAFSAEHPRLAHRWQQRSLDDGLKKEVSDWLCQGTSSFTPAAPLRSLSLRQQQRLYKQCVGVSLQTLYSIERFHKAWEALTQNPHQPLQGLAYALGYSDQSHLTREFKRFAGMTPTAYVVFVQDGLQYS